MLTGVQAKIVPATLQNDAGIVGAAMAAASTPAATETAASRAATETAGASAG